MTARFTVRDSTPPSVRMGARRASLPVEGTFAFNNSRRNAERASFIAGTIGTATGLCCLGYMLLRVALG